MECQRVINLIDNTSNKPSNFTTKNSVKISDKSKETYNTNSQIKFKTKMLKSGLCGLCGLCGYVIMWSGSYFINSRSCKLLEQLKSGFKKIIICNKHLAKPELLVKNLNVNRLVELNFQGVNRTFVLVFEYDAQRTGNKRDIIFQM